MSFKRYRIIFILVFMLVSGIAGDQTTNQQQHMTNDMETVQSDTKEGRVLFPRMEYTNEWQPVGWRDPLKQEPTFDYMPPFLDRVRYWGDSSSNKNKNDILLLGVPSKKMPSNKQKEKFNYGPIKRNYHSQPYQGQQQYSPPHYQNQQTQFLPQRLMPPTSKYPVDAHHMSPQHYQVHPHQQHQQYHNWKAPDSRPEHSVNHVMTSRPPTPTRPPTSGPFLPTIVPSDIPIVESSATPPTRKPNGPTMSSHMMRETTKPLLQSILRTETASPFTKRPSSAYQIEYTSNIYNPEAINSMAFSSSYTTTFTPSKATKRPGSVETSPVPSKTNVAPQEHKHYVQPDMHWPVYNLIIEGHSKVKTYGLKNGGEIESNLPKIRPVQPNPVVEHVTHDEKGPEFVTKQPAINKKDLKKPAKKSDEVKSPMASIFSLIESSFGNFLPEDGVESENKLVKNEKKSPEKHKTRRSISDDEESKQEKVFSVSFQVNDGEKQPQTHYRKGTVIPEKLWPFDTDETSE